MVILSVIIPVKMEVYNRNYKRNIQMMTDIARCSGVDNIEYIVVDDGSKDSLSEEMRSFCEGNGLRYLHTGAAAQDVFNIARTRNHGVRHARGEFVLFLDADLLPYEGFYQDIFDEIMLLDMRRHVKRFLMCPVIYLTPAGAEAMSRLSRRQIRQYGINALLSANQADIERYSLGTSAIVVNRYYYLALGGQDEKFQGWGYEDYEFALRLIQENPRFEIPDNWSSMAGNFHNLREYQGWKAIYMMHGAWMAGKGIYLFHLPHPPDTQGQAFKKGNELRLKKKLRDPAGMRHQQASPLADGNTLATPRAATFLGRETAPFTGAIIELGQEPATAADLDALKQRHDIRRAVVAEPFDDSRDEQLHAWCRENDVECIIAGHGALPGTCYFDQTGTLAESSLWPPENWDHSLPEQAEDEMRAWRKKLLAHAQASPPPSGSPSANTPEKRRILLIDDCADEFRAMPDRGQGMEHDAYRTLIHALNKERHAKLEFSLVRLTATPFWRLEREFATLLAQLPKSDAVLVHGSDAALLAMLLDIPVYAASRCHFSHPGLVRDLRAGSTAEMAEALMETFMPDKEKVRRFLHFVFCRHYSVLADDAREETAENVNGWAGYEILRGWTEEPLHFTKDPEIPFSSPLYDRFRDKRNVRPLDCIRMLARYKDRILGFWGKVGK